jgi:hypothetical protein
MRDGKLLKYEMPAGTSARIDVPLSCRAKLRDANEPLLVTEGCLKADAAATQGLCCVALNGVWSYREEALRDWDEIPLRKRRVLIAFDSDAATNPNVRKALFRLKAFLEGRGARVEVIYLPPGENGEKVGLDDFLAGQRSADVFAFAEENIRPLDGETQNLDLADAEYRAVFPGLVDIVVDTTGCPHFLLETECGQIVQPTAEVAGILCQPPPPDQLPWALPRAEQVLEALRAYQTDATSVVNARLFDDLVSYHREVSELPEDAWYDLLAAYDFHTYLYERFEYSPILCLFAVPERGKSRTGKGVAYVAFRGIHVESLRDSYIVRVASNLHAMLFFDVMDVWKRAEKAGSEDILLHRYEKGAKVPRVLYPEKGAFRDTVYYDIFGPTVIATNEGVHKILDTRCVPLTMPETARRFETAVTPGMGLPLRERLVAFRAIHASTTLPQVPKPAPGRLGDILQPLFQIVDMVKPERAEALQGLVNKIKDRRLTESADTLEAHVVRIVRDSLDHADKGALRVGVIVDSINEDRPEHLHYTSQRIGRVLTSLGFERHRQGATGSAAYLMDQGLIARLCTRYGLTDASDTSDTKHTEDEQEPSLGLSEVSEASERVSPARAIAPLEYIDAPPICINPTHTRQWIGFDGQRICESCYPKPANLRRVLA